MRLRHFEPLGGQLLQPLRLIALGIALDEDLVLSPGSRPRPPGDRAPAPGRGRCRGPACRASRRGRRRPSAPRGGGRRACPCRPRPVPRWGRAWPGSTPPAPGSTGRRGRAPLSAPWSRATCLRAWPSISRPVASLNRHAPAHPTSAMTPVRAAIWCSGCRRQLAGFSASSAGLRHSSRSGGCSRDRCWLAHRVALRSAGPGAVAPRHLATSRSFCRSAGSLRLDSRTGSLGNLVNA